MFNVQHTRLPNLPWKRILFGSLGGSVGILGVLLGVAIYIVETLTRPKRLQHAIEMYTFSPFELDLPAEEVAFPPLYGDHLVSGWYIPHVRATATILICPGYRGQRADVLGMAQQVWKAGYNVLAFEYYGHGTIVGKPVTLGYREINDFLGAVTYAKERAPQTRLGAIGYSMGASIAIMACARTTEIEVLVADSPFASNESAVGYAVYRTLHLPFFLFEWTTDLILWLRAGYHFHQVEPWREIGRIAPRPVMLIQGMKDTIVNPKDAFLLYEAANDPKELWILPNVDHCGAYFDDRPLYIRRVISFLDLYLKQSRPYLLSRGQKQQDLDEDDTDLSEAG
jgi:fermentation-respiration switch protein FrsA (DUF1100 family)